ncbi:hypothetical protein Hanom_Chr07g00667061 [Helianthus anomalus]
MGFDRNKVPCENFDCLANDSKIEVENVAPNGGRVIGEVEATGIGAKERDG